MNDVPRRCCLSLLLVLAASSPARALTHEVGPGLMHENVSDVPWESLAPGDLVLIHWRPDPYREKWQGQLALLPQHHHQSS